MGSVFRLGDSNRSLRRQLWRSPRSRAEPSPSVPDPRATYAR